MAKKNAKWMSALKLDEGSFSAKARRAGKSTVEYSEEKAHAPGKLGKQARLAKVFAKARHKKK